MVSHNISGSYGLDIGEDAQSGQGSLNGTYCTIDHNTVPYGIHLWLDRGGSNSSHNTLTNNILGSHSIEGGSNNSWDHNLYISGAAIGAHDLANSTPIFVNGTSPTTIEGFALSSSSPGYHGADDGTDIGANTNLVGVTTTEENSVCSSFVYSDWGACQLDNTQSRTISNSLPTGCVGGSPVLMQTCTYVQAVITCASFTYSDWGACQSDGTQTRTLAASSPDNCVGGSPVLTQSCSYNSGSSGGSSSSGGGSGSVSTGSVGTADQIDIIVSENDTSSNSASTIASTTQNLLSITDLNNQPSAIVNNVTKEEATIVDNYNQRVGLTKVEIDLYQKIMERNSAVLLNNDKYSLAHFIHYGTPSTQKLGSGERAGVINSYQSAMAKLPTTADDWQDVIKIANGRWPIKQNTITETNASNAFKIIYLRTANADNAHDSAAIMIMAYGLRPLQRNLVSEKAAINSFKYIYHASPVTAQDWDKVRAVAYSGASR